MSISQGYEYQDGINSLDRVLIVGLGIIEAGPTASIAGTGSRRRCGLPGIRRGYGLRPGMSQGLGWARFQACLLRLE
jgi:hypothetical protein